MPEESLADTKSVWRSPAYPQLHQQEWEHEFFVFNPASGDTHLLNPLSMEILRLLGGNPLTLEQLLERLQLLIDDGEPPLSSMVMHQHLAQLDLMGLIAPATGDHRSA